METQNQNQKNSNSKGIAILLVVFGIVSMLVAYFALLPMGIDGVYASTGLPAFNTFHYAGMLFFFGGIGLILIGGIVFSISFFKT